MTTQRSSTEGGSARAHPLTRPEVNRPPVSARPSPVCAGGQGGVASVRPSRGGVPGSCPAAEFDHLSGDPRSLLAVRLLAAAALLVTALIHARLAFQLGLGGAPLGRGQLFFIQAVFSAAIATAIFTNNNRAWLLAVVFSAAGLIAILASVYFPITAVGPFPAIDEPTWLLTKAICALAELTVIALWAIRRIAPSSLPE